MRSGSIKTAKKKTTSYVCFYVMMSNVGMHCSFALEKWKVNFGFNLMPNMTWYIFNREYLGSMPHSTRG